MILQFNIHDKLGRLTDFPGKILRGEKIHTIRRGKLWQEGHQIEMLVRMEGSPALVFNDAISKLQRCTGTQDIIIQNEGETIHVWIDGKEFTRIDELAKNDGMTRAEFLAWFTEPHFEGQIVHWTDKRY